MAIADLTQTQKEELAISLAVLAVHDAKAEMSAENLSAALAASGVSVAAYLPALFADLIGRGLKVDKFLAGPSAGAASSGAATAAAGGAAAAAVEEEVEEEEADMGGAGMDMFGGGSDY